MGGTKDVTKSLRFSGEQWRRAVKAARLESKRTGQRVYPTVLLAEVGMKGVDQILSSADQAAAPAA